MAEEAKLIDLMVIDSDLNDETALKGLVCRAVSAVRPPDSDVGDVDVYAPKKKWKAHYLKQGNDPQEFQAFFQPDNPEENPPAGVNVQILEEQPENGAIAAPEIQNGIPDEAPPVPPLPEPLPSLPIVVEPRLELPSLPNGQPLNMDMGMAMGMDVPNLPSTSKDSKDMELPKPHLLVPPAGVSMVYSDPQSGMIVERSLDVPPPAVVTNKGKSSNRNVQTSNTNNGASTSVAGPSGQGTREVHNRLEKYRRAQLKECYDELKRVLPNISETRKVSNLIVLRNAHKYIQSLKRKEKEYEHEMDRLARKKIEMNQMYLQVRDELARMYGSEKAIDWDELEEMARMTVERRRSQTNNPVPGPSSAMGNYQWRHEQKSGPRVDEDGDSNTSTASECADMEDYEFVGSGASTSSGFSERRSTSSSSSIRYHQSPAGSATSSRSCSNGKASPGVKRHSPPTSRYPGGAKRVSPMMYPPTPPNMAYSSMSSAASLPASPPMHVMHSPKCFSVPPVGAHLVSVGLNPLAGPTEVESRHGYQPHWAPEASNVQAMVERSPQPVISPQPPAERSLQEYPVPYTPRSEEESDVLDLSISSAKSQFEEQAVLSPPMHPSTPSPAPSAGPLVYYQRQPAGPNAGFDHTRSYHRQLPPTTSFAAVREPAGHYNVSPGGSQQRPAPQPISYHQHQEALRHLRLQPEDAAKMPSDPAFQAALRANMGLPPLGPGMPFPPPRPPEGVIKVPPHPLEMSMSAFGAATGGVRMMHQMHTSIGMKPMIQMAPERLSPASKVPAGLIMASASHGLPNGIHVAKVPHGSPLEFGRVAPKPGHSPILTAAASGPIMSATTTTGTTMPIGHLAHHVTSTHNHGHSQMLITAHHMPKPMNNPTLPPMGVPFMNNTHLMYRPTGIVPMPHPMPQQSRCDTKPVLT